MYHRGGNSSRAQQKENRGITRIQASSSIASSQIGVVSTPVARIGETIAELVRPSGSPTLRAQNVLLSPKARGVAPE
jgi:hypothetical protein